MASNRTWLVYRAISPSKKRGPASESTKRKISNALLGRVASDVTRARQSARRKGRPLSEAARGKLLKPVIRSDGLLFASVNEAASALNVTHGAVGSAIRRKGTCGGYRFQFVV